MEEEVHRSNLDLILWKKTTDLRQKRACKDLAISKMGIAKPDVMTICKCSSRQSGVEHKHQIWDSCQNREAICKGRKCKPNTHKSKTCEKGSLGSEKTVWVFLHSIQPQKAQVQIYMKFPLQYEITYREIHLWTSTVHIKAICRGHLDMHVNLHSRGFKGATANRENSFFRERLP